jgi:hypothetical protein
VSILDLKSRPPKKRRNLKGDEKYGSKQLHGNGPFTYIIKTFDCHEGNEAVLEQNMM